MFSPNLQLHAQGFNLPKAITNLIGTSHTFELKTSSYFEHGTFESFTCWNVTRAHGELTCSSTPQREGKPIVKKDFVQRSKFVYSNKILEGEKTKTVSPCLNTMEVMSENVLP